ncbi:hypothetical protein H4R34_002404 [Dimargaris verticillata]|uniref:Homeobox domain-containing protein n=1 Tax=Dimargaris verticillata TaxID=2761393 RepID=A0A9W8EE40_9FUNG|nr:hypothetical protein H4R34_002404 [Dimargaris verticillata]
MSHAFNSARQPTMVYSSYPHMSARAAQSTAVKASPQQPKYSMGAFRAGSRYVPKGVAWPSCRQSQIAVPAAGGQTQRELSWVHELPSRFKRRAAGDTAPKPKRRRLTQEQCEVLETAFSADPMPDRETKDKLVQQTGMDLKYIQIWFQNKRQSAKKKQGQQPKPGATKRDGETKGDGALLTQPIAKASVPSTPLLSRPPALGSGASAKRGRPCNSSRMMVSQTRPILPKPSTDRGPKGPSAAITECSGIARPQSAPLRDEFRLMPYTEPMTPVMVTTAGLPMRSQTTDPLAAVSMHAAPKRVTAGISLPSMTELVSTIAQKRAEDNISTASSSSTSSQRPTVGNQLPPLASPRYAAVAQSPASAKYYKHHMPRTHFPQPSPQSSPGSLLSGVAEFSGPENALPKLRLPLDYPSPNPSVKTGNSVHALLN